MPAIVTSKDAGSGKTKCTARARHWSAADREAHEKMGFQVGGASPPTSLRLSCREFEPDSPFALLVKSIWPPNTSS